MKKVKHILSVIFLYELIYGLYLDIRELRKFKRILNTIKQKKEWKEYNLRVDWINRIYTVLTSSEWEIGNNMAQTTYFHFERSKPISGFLASEGLGDYLTPPIFKEIEETNGYQFLVYYQYRTYILNRTNILKYLTLLSIYIGTLVIFIK